MKSKPKTFLNDSRIWIGSTIALAIVLVIVLASGSFAGGLSTHVVDKNAAASNAINFINVRVLRGQATAELKSVEDWNGLYKLIITVNGRDIPVYVTKDGQFLIPQAINMSYVPPEVKPKEIPKSANPTAMLFTMAFCPYGNQAENNIAPVVSALKNVIEIVPHYIVSKTSVKNGTIDEMYASLHGPQELHQDVRELCVYKYNKDKYWDFVLGINKNCSPSNADTCWESIAQSVGINVSNITNCYKNEAKTLLENEAKLDEQYSVSSSPTLLINNVEYSGQRTPQAYMDAICSAFETEPAVCNTTINSTATAPASGNC